MKNARVLAGVFLSVLIPACAQLVPQTADLREQWPQGVPDQVQIADAPFFPQREFECGPAALATALAHYGVPVTADDLVPLVYLPGREGSVQAEMLAAPRRFGLVAYELAPRFEHVIREVADGTPVVVLQRLGPGPFAYWHYATAVGYDAHIGSITLRSGETRDAWMPLPLFELTWKKSAYWAMVALPPDRIPATADRERYLRAIVALERAGQLKAAAIAYATYLGRWPDELGASIGLGNAHYSLHELDKAADALRQALARHPDSVVVMNNLAQTLSDQDRNAEALALIDKAKAAAGPHAAAIEETRALILKRLGKP